MKYIIVVFSFFIASYANAQWCPLGSSYSLSDSTCGQISPGVTISCGSISFCVSDSIGITTTSAIPFDSVFICWGDGTTDTVPGNITNCLYHKYNFKQDTCLGNGNNYLNPAVTIFFLKHCGLGYSSTTFNTYPKVKFMPKCTFAIPDSICVGQDLLINPLGCANADVLDTTQIIWNMGNGTIFNLYSTNSNVTVPAPAYQYPVAGNYTVTLTMTNSCGTGTYSRVVHVKAKPVLNPVLTNYGGCTPDTLTVNVNSQNTFGYVWFWDVTPAGGVNIINPTDSEPTFQALLTNNYNFHLIIADGVCCTPFNFGSWCEWSDTVTFLQGPSVSNSGINDTCVSLPVNYNLNIAQYLTFGTSNTDSSWQLLDGTTNVPISSAGIANITDTGTYHLNVTVLNSCDTITVPYIFHVNTPPPPPNILSDSTVCVNAPVVNLNAISNPVTGIWTQGGAQLNPALFYPNLATQNSNTLILYVGPFGCDITDTLTLNVIGIGTTAGTDQIICSNSDTINLAVNAIPQGGIWNGDGITDSLNGTYNPDSALLASSIITYTVNLSGCSITDTVTVTLNTPPAAAFTIPSCVCTNVSATFSDTIAGTIATWDFGDATGLVVANTTNHIYTSSGSYTVTLAIENTAAPFCKDTIHQQINVSDAANAQFSLINDTICSNDQITFIASVIDTNYTYAWTFGDGSIDSVYNPAPHSYPTDSIIRTYLINLSVTNCCGTVTHLDSVVVNPSPVAGFAIINTIDCSPDTAYFYDFSAGTPDAFTLYINGVPSPILPYYVLTANNADSIYQFMLVASNECGSDTMIVSDTIHPGTIKALFNASPLTICKNETVTFISVTNLLIPSASVVWDFGDGNIASADTITHTYTNPGTYTAWMHVYKCGVDSISKIITVHDSPKDTFSVSAANCVNEPVQFNNLSNAVGYSWNFGDGSSLDSTVNPLHQFAAIGTYTTSLIGINIFGCRDTFSLPVNVLGIPHADFAVPANQACLGGSIALTGNSTGASFYNWDMGNSTTLTSPPPINYVYPDTGTYTVTLTVTDANNCSDDTSYSYVYIHPNAEALFTYTQVPLCAMPAVVNFNNQSTSALSYVWHFGNTDSSAQTYPVLSFTNDTVFTTVLTANNLYNCPGSYSLPVKIYAAPTALFTASDTLLCPGETALFTNISSSNANSFQWYFGNGISSTSFSPSAQAYNAAGNYTVTLIVGNDSVCYDTLSLSSYIKVYTEPVADFTFHPVDSIVNHISFNPSGYYQFNDMSSNATKLIWDFDDGTADSIRNPLHLYYSSGEKCVTLTAFNADDCADSVTYCFILELPGTLYLPNSITPDNGLDQERYFIPKGTSISTFKLEIFSPFGERVWECDENGPFVNGEAKCRWNGTDDKGKALPQGAYVWKVTGYFENGQKVGNMSKEGEVKTVGTVMLIR